MFQEITDGRLVLSDSERRYYVESFGPNIVRFSEKIEHDTPAAIATKRDFSFSVTASEEESVMVGLRDCTLRIKKDFSLILSCQEGVLLKEIPFGYHSPEPNDHTPVTEGRKFIGGTEYPLLRSFALTDEAFYGLGDHPGPLNRRGYEFINWNSDQPYAHTDNFKSLYKSSPFVMIKKGGVFFGVFFDNSYKTIFNCGVDERQWFLGATKGHEDYYLIYGPTAADVVKGFASLVGSFPLPARWTLGYGQSRWSYGSEQAVKDVVGGYKQINIPLSAVYLDIDYMDGFRVFTVDKQRFPHLKELIASLHKEGIKVVAIVDPGVKVDPAYDVYADGLKKKVFGQLGGEPYVNQVWPGDSVFPSFNEERVRAWWSSLCPRLINYGLDGLWTDMNEPASFKGPLPNEVRFGDDAHEKIHNLYGHYMAEATFEGLQAATKKRPFVITRACFSGTNRYSTVWTGDNQSIYSHLRLAIPQQLNMGLSLMPFVGTDIGGFSGDCPKELMARWIELGSFSPLFRNHSDCACHPQEAFRYPEPIQKIYRRWVRFRYTLTPYYYDLFYEERFNGLPALRPLFMESGEEKFSNLNTEFMVGSSILVAPVLEPGATSRLLSLPNGKWYSYDGKENLSGGDYAKDCPLGSALVYVKEGSIIPEYPDGYTNLDESPVELTVRLFPGEGRYLHYQDAGDGYGYLKGEYNLYEFTNDNGKFAFHLIHEGFKKYRSFRVLFLNKEETILAD